MDRHQRDTLFSSSSGEYETPAWVFDPLNEHFGFTLDAAASHENHKVPLYYTVDGLYSQHFSTPSRRNACDGLLGPWAYAVVRPGGAPRSVWLNPPYGRGIEAWVQKCVAESRIGATVVALLPARTDTSWFHRWVAPYADVYFLMGRINFVGAAASAPFPSIIAVYRQHPPTVRTHALDLKSGGFP